MNPGNIYLLPGGIASLMITLLHVILAIRPQLYSYFGADALRSIK